MEIMKYQYRKIFKLSAKQLEDEPIDEFFTNLTIWGLIEKKKELELKHGSK
jgi:hypothetical protein